MFPVSEKSPKGPHDGISNNSLTANNKESGMLMKVIEYEDQNDTITSQESKVPPSSMNELVVEAAVLETSSDDGWQEASSKGRSGGTAKKNIRKRPNLAKIKTSSAYSYSRDRMSRKEVISQGHNGTSKTVSSEFSLPMKALNLNFSGDSENVSAKVAVPKGFPSSGVSVPSPPANLTTMASKSLSYKDVAVAPPGTVLKPLLEKVEELNKDNSDSQISISPPKTPEEDGRHTVTSEDSTANLDDKPVTDESKTATTQDTCGNIDDKEVQKSGGNIESESSLSEVDDVSSPSTQEKPVEANGSKLSAAAPPFNPGAYAVTHLLNRAAVASVYDEMARQGMLIESVGFPSIAARVPCGPRSPMYYRSTHSRVKNGYTKYHTSSGAARTMNPHAPEFVPRQAWKSSSTEEDSKVAPAGCDSVAEQSTDDAKSNKSSKSSSTSDAEKTELARQILLSFIVKSVQHSSDTPTESPVTEKKSGLPASSAEAIANDSAIIKIQYGNDEGKTTEAKNKESSKMVDVNSNNNGDGEGFVVVTKRRRNRSKISNGMGELYSQQSICASVR